MKPGYGLLSTWLHDEPGRRDKVSDQHHRDSLQEDVQHTKKNAAYEWHRAERKRRDHWQAAQTASEEDKIPTHGEGDDTPHAATDNPRRRITMAIGNGMLAQALLDYFDQHTEECKTFLLDRAAIADGYVIWKGDTPNKRSCSRSRSSVRMAASGLNATMPSKSKHSKVWHRLCHRQNWWQVYGNTAASPPDQGVRHPRHPGFCRKVRFLGKIQKSGVRNSMTYRLPNSRKSNFATEPRSAHRRTP